MDYEKPLRPKRPKKKKPFVIEFRSTDDRWWWPKDWSKWGSYTNKRGMDDALRSCERKYDYLEFRTKER